MVFVDALDTNVSTWVAQAAVRDFARILLTPGNGLLFGHLQRIPLIALGTLISKSLLTGLAIVDSADLAALFPTIRLLVAFLTNRTIFS